MNELDLKNAWLSYDRKLDRLLEVNFQQLKDIQSIKAGSKINSFKKSHIFVMLLGVSWVWFLSFLVYHTKDNPYFTISVGLIILFNVFAVVLYLHHIIILSSVNIGGSIIETQRKLAQVVYFLCPGRARAAAANAIVLHMVVYRRTCAAWRVHFLDDTGINCHLIYRDGNLSVQKAIT
jgi:hypothetical protein